MIFNDINVNYFIHNNIYFYDISLFIHELSTQSNITIVIRRMFPDIESYSNTNTAIIIYTSVIKYHFISVIVSRE